MVLYDYEDQSPVVKLWRDVTYSYIIMYTSFDGLNFGLREQKIDSLLPLR